MSETDTSVQIRRGMLAAVAAFSLWGLFPLYWVQISHVPPLEVIWHRVLWGAVLAWLIVLWRRFRARQSVRAGRGTRAGLRGGHHANSPSPPVAPTGAPTAAPPPLLPQWPVLGWLMLNGALVVVNWLVYVWAVSSGRTLDASLGYYINPLVSVLLGMVFFRDRLSRLQWAAVASATVGVLVLTVRLGVFPWVSLTLACTFGTYGLIKKRTVMSAIHSLAVELTALAVPAGVMILAGVARGTGVPADGDWTAAAFLLGGGVVTVLPLLLFGLAAQRIRLSDVGFLQYIAPTTMFGIAVLVFREPLEPGRLAGFVFVWIGLALYTTSTLRSARARRRAAGLVVPETPRG